MKKARDRAFKMNRLDLFEDQRTVSAAEAEGVTQGVIHTRYLACFMWHKIQIATFIRVIQVDGWRDNLVTQSQNREDRLYSTRSA